MARNFKAKKRAPLAAAIETRRGRDIPLELQRKHEKVVEKKRQKKAQENLEKMVEEEEARADGTVEDDEEMVDDREASGSGSETDGEENEEDFEEFGEDGELVYRGTLDGNSPQSKEEEAQTPQPATSTTTNEATTNHTDDLPSRESSIPLSDLSSQSQSQDEHQDRDIIPHQRLSINNTTALTSALTRLRPPTTPPFSTTQSHTTPTATSSRIPNPDDDLTRELALYAQSLASARAGLSLLKSEDPNHPTSRPPDYFAEMLKPDEHMGRVRARLVADASAAKASQDAKRQRELKKFGKAVQVEKQKERAKARREQLERVDLLKRKRKGAGVGDAEADGEGLFDVAVEEAAEESRRKRTKTGGDRGDGGKRDAKPNAKRQSKDKRFGFGGRKKYSKSVDAVSTGDMRGFSTRKMKASSKASAKRPGKSRRAKQKG